MNARRNGFASRGAIATIGAAALVLAALVAVIGSAQAAPSTKVYDATVRRDGRSVDARRAAKFTLDARRTTRRASRRSVRRTSRAATGHHGPDAGASSRRRAAGLAGRSAATERRRRVPLDVERAALARRDACRRTSLVTSIDELHARCDLDGAGEAVERLQRHRERLQPELRVGPRRRSAASTSPTIETVTDDEQHDPRDPHGRAVRRATDDRQGHLRRCTKTTTAARPARPTLDSTGAGRTAPPSRTDRGTSGVGTVDDHAEVTETGNMPDRDGRDHGRQRHEQRLRRRRQALHADDTETCDWQDNAARSRTTPSRRLPTRASGSASTRTWHLLLRGDASTPVGGRARQHQSARLHRRRAHRGHADLQEVGDGKGRRPASTSASARTTWRRGPCSTQCASTSPLPRTLRASSRGSA